MNCLAIVSLFWHSYFAIYFSLKSGQLAAENCSFLGMVNKHCESMVTTSAFIYIRRIVFRRNMKSTRVCLNSVTNKYISETINWDICKQKACKCFNLSDLAGPTTQFLNGTHEFSELVLAKMSLLVDQSRSVLLLRLAKAREFGELRRDKCTRAPWTFPLKIGQKQFFSASKNRLMENDLSFNQT